MADLLTMQLLTSVVVILVMINVILLIIAYSIYLERKISAYIQDRLGPNRVGFDFGLPFLKRLRGAVGLGQPMADGLKFLLKEDYTPDNVDKGLYTFAPMAIIIPALIGFAVIPWGGVWNAPDVTLFGITFTGGQVVVAGAPVNIGIIYILAVASVGVYGVTLGGWASNNKYSFLGGLRATAQMLAYEIPLGLCLLAVLLLVGSLVPQDIVRYQVEHGWIALAQPVAMIIFFTAMLAEANRTPFDNAEAENELVGGYHTEYSSMRFALYFLAEYSHMITSSALFVLLFLGGYHLPLVGFLGPEAVGIGAVLAKTVVYVTKVVLMVCFMMVVRWTVPRLRYDQVMHMAWQAIIPISLIIVLMTSVMVYLRQTSWPVLLGANAVLIGGLLAIYPMLPRFTANRKVPMLGSRFSPLPGEVVRTAPSNPMALEDRPVEGTVPTTA
ncbi:MAG: NADH-quinone oxidoreductase subunit NuoH [Phycisphaerales bacterium JB039]